MKLSNLLSVAAVALALGVTAGVEQANAQINSPVPSSAYIVNDGLEWAWGGPCPYTGGCYATGSLAYQGGQGWSLPTATELAYVDSYDSMNSSAFADLFLNNPSGNVPAGGTDPVSGAYFADGGDPTQGSCATPYFATVTTWCDAGNGESGYWAESPFTIAAGAEDYAEQLYVRSASGIPEPAIWAMLLMGIGGIGASMRVSRQKHLGAAAA